MYTKFIFSKLTENSYKKMNTVLYITVYLIGIYFSFRYNSVLVQTNKTYY